MNYFINTWEKLNTYIFVQWSSSEMVVNKMSSFQKVNKVFESDVKSNCHTYNGV